MYLERFWYIVNFQPQPVPSANGLSIEAPGWSRPPLPVMTTHLHLPQPTKPSLDSRSTAVSPPARPNYFPRHSTLLPCPPLLHRIQTNKSAPSIWPIRAHSHASRKHVSSMPFCPPPLSIVQSIQSVDLNASITFGMICRMDIRLRSSGGRLVGRGC